MGKGNHNERRLHFVIYNIKRNDFKNVNTMNKTCFHKSYNCSNANSGNWIKM